MAAFYLAAAVRLGATGNPESQPYRIDSWGVEQGLPQSSITSIVQTHNGYLWLGTFGGLVRFDGVQFKVFNPNNSPGLPSSRIVKLFEDREGALWIGTEEGQLARYAAGRFDVCAPPGWGKVSGYVQNFVQAGDGTLWAMTSQGQLIRFAGDPVSVGSAAWRLERTNVNDLATNSRGQIWIGTDNQISVWQDGHFAEVGEESRREGFGPCVLAGARDGGCWVAANGSLRKYKQGGGVIDHGNYPSSKGDVDCMMEDRQGQVWVGMYGSGLYRYGTNGVVLHLAASDGLSGDFISAIQEDREGNVWLGTESCGLVRLKPALFRSFGRQQGLAGDCVLSVCEGADNEIWIGLNGDGVDRLKNGAIQHYGARQGLTNAYVWSVFQDRRDNVWAGTWGGGLFKLEKETFGSFADAADCGGIVCAVFEDPTSSLWVGRQRSVPEITRVMGGKPMRLSLQGPSNGTDVRAISGDRSGNLWIGTQGDGLYCLKQGKQEHFGKREGLNNEFIRSLYADSDNVLWIGTYGGGLNRLENGRFTPITTKEGLVNDSLGYIAEDSHANLWCGSLGGVFRVSKAELNRFASGEIRSIRCVAYTESDGLPSRECTGGCQPSGCKSRDGRLWFPTIRGLAEVDPDQVAVNLLPPPVAIEEVIMEGKVRSSIFDAANSLGTVDADSKGAGSERAPLRIAPGTQRLEFHYTGLSLTAPMKVQFKYKLDGLDEDWVEAGTRRVANYSHLQPRTYRFSVLACNNDGIWDQEGASLALVILPHFWQTWWFLVLCILAVILLFVAVYEFRLATERKLVRMRLRIASDLHDEVGSNLGSIALLSEMIPKHTFGSAEEISEIRRITLETASSLRDIVWFLDPAGEKMDDLILRMKDTARTMLAGIDFEFRASGDTGGADPSLHFRRNVFPMFKEVLHNIVKHSSATHVEIKVQVAARQFEFSVKDDGTGFAEAGPRGGNGLKNLKRRAGELAGEVTIESQPGKGTKVTLSAPIT